MLPYTDGAEADGIVEIAVQEVVAGSRDEVQAAVPDEDLSEGEPYYVRSSVTGVANSDTLAFTQPSIYLSVVLSDGSQPAELFAGSAVDECTSGSAEGDFANGSSYDDCRIVLVPAGLQVAQVIYGPSKAGLEEYGRFTGAPVVWQ